MKNPLRLDPTRTGLLRRQFIAEIAARFNRLQKQVWAEMGKRQIVANAPFVFETNDKKLKKFNAWLQDQVNQGILQLSPARGEPSGPNAWMYKYIDSAYRKGAVRAYLATRKRDYSKPQSFYDGSRAEFMTQAFADGERVSKIRMLYLRSYENLKGITAHMSAKISQIMADGMANGKSSRSIARQISRQISGISRTRAQVLASTEIIHAHAEGQLDSFVELAVKKVGAEVEFSTSGDDGVCKKCRRLNGRIYTIKQARGKIPVHPRCRCSWLPVISLPKRKRK